MVDWFLSKLRFFSFILDYNITVLLTGTLESFLSNFCLTINILKYKIELLKYIKILH